jgi:hypothetical protein
VAIYHLNAKVISRGKGQSAIAASAYRSGDRLRDEKTGEQKFYPSREERIQFTDIMAPKDAPEWAHDRNRLWNEAEKAEKRKDAQLAREIEISLPHELTGPQREGLIKDYAREAFVRKGYAVDIAIHAPDRVSDDRNYHAHLMITMRTLGPNGFAAKKDRDLNSKDQLKAWRKQWANLANRHLERHVHKERIDHRSLKAQGVDREATMHLGYAANEIAHRGGQSDRMDELKEILARNEIRTDIKALTQELAELEREQAQLAAARVHQSDEKKRDTLAGRGFVDGAKSEANDIRQERRDKEFQKQQENWRQSRDERRPASSARPVEAAARAASGGLHVMGAATGVVSKLGDFMLGLLAGPPSSPPPGQQPKKKPLVTRLDKERADKALARMGADMEAGRNLRAEDIQLLTEQQKETIRTRGDEAVRDLVDDARRRAELAREEERGRGMDR